jgi:hypothetical protein
VLDVLDEDVLLADDELAAPVEVEVESGAPRQAA